MGSLKSGLRPPLEIPENCTQYAKKRAAPPKAARFFFNDISLFVRYDIFLAENDITPYRNASTAYVTPLSFSDAMPLPSVGAVWVWRTVTCAVESVTPRLFWPPAAMPAYCFVQPVVACENGLSTAKTITALGLKPNKIVREAAPVPVYVRTSVGVSKRFLRVSFKCRLSF